jgi:chemotaxis protein MotB
MARNSWEMGAETAFTGGDRPRGGRAWRILGGLFFIATATFVMAYYVPLRRAHQSLTALYLAATERAADFERKLGEAQTALASVTRERDALRAAEGERQSSLGAEKQKQSALMAELGQNLRRLVERRRAALSLADGHPSISVPEDALFKAGKDDVSPQGVAVLCEIAKATGSRGLRVSAGIDGPSPGAGPPSAWSLAATRTAHLAEALAARCNVPNDRLSVAVAGKPSSSDAPATTRVDVLDDAVH